MKILVILLVFSLLSAGFSVSENQSYVKVVEDGYSISLSKTLPLVIINYSGGMFAYAVTRIITSDGKNLQLYNITWQKWFLRDTSVKYGMISIEEGSRIEFNFSINSTYSSINIYISMSIYNIHGKSIGVIEHFINTTDQLRNIEKVDREMNYQFISVPQMSMMVKDNIKYVLKNGTFYISQNGKNSSSLMVFYPVNGSEVTLNSIISIPFSSYRSYSPDIYPLVGVAFGILVIVSGLIILRRRL